MRDRIPTKVLDNGAVRYAVYDENGAFLRYEYMLPADEPVDEGTALNKANILSDDVEAAIWGAAADRTIGNAFSKMSELYQHWWSATNGIGTTTCVHSPDRNAYPDSGTVDGLTYKYMGVPFNNALDPGIIHKAELLYEYTMPSAIASMSIPMSNIDWNKYDYLVIDTDVEADVSTSGILWRINNDSTDNTQGTAVVRSGSSVSYTEYRVAYSAKAGKKRLIFSVYKNANNYIQASFDYPSGHGWGWFGEKKYSSVTTMAITANTTNAKIKAGGKVKIYGLYGEGFPW